MTFQSDWSGAAVDQKSKNSGCSDLIIELIILPYYDALFSVPTEHPFLRYSGLEFPKRFFTLERLFHQSCRDEWNCLSSRDSQFRSSFWKVLVRRNVVFVFDHFIKIVAYVFGIITRVLKVVSDAFDSPKSMSDITFSCLQIFVNRLKQAQNFEYRVCNEEEVVTFQNFDQTTSLDANFCMGHIIL